MRTTFDRDEKPVVERDVRLDSSNRVTISKPMYEYYAMKQFADGTIVLEPRVLVTPGEVSRRVLSDMDDVMRNLGAGVAGDEFDLTEVQDLLDEE